MKFCYITNVKVQLQLKNCWKIFFRLTLFYLIILPPASTLTGCTVTIIDVKLAHLQVLCDHEHAKLSAIPKNLKIETRILELSMQNITSLQPKSFEDVVYLKKLIIKSSNLHHIDRLAFKVLNQLETLILRNNSLELTDASLPGECFKFLVSLKHLDLSQNPIHFISDFYFKFLGFTLLSLTLSDLADDLLLSTHSFNSLNQLEYLDLTFNKLKTIRKNSLGNIVQRSYYNSTTVLLAGNLWNCDCRLRWIREWYYHNLPRLTVNLIEEIRPGMRKILRPFCQYPITARNKYLFPTQSSTLSIQEMKCDERSLTNSTSIIVMENANVTFHCTFLINYETNYETRIEWYKNGVKVTLRNTGKYLSSTKVDNFKLFAKLLIYHVKIADQGKWECNLITQDSFRKISTVFRLIVKSDEVIILSSRSKKLLIYISVSLLTFLLIVFLIGTSFYFCFRYHKPINSLQSTQKSNQPSSDKEIRPKTVTINPQGNHLLLYDDCNVVEDKIFNHYEPYRAKYIDSCACKDCSNKMKKCAYFNSLSIETKDDLSIDDQDNKKFSLCPVHGDCNLSIAEILPNIEPKKACPVHGTLSSKNMPEICTEIHNRYGSLKVPDSKKSVILSAHPRNDIVLTSINKNKNSYLNCPLHGKVLSLNPT